MRQDSAKPYRCAIAPEDSDCRVRIGRRDVVCEVIDLSREDFRVRIPASALKAIRRARRIELRYRGERWLVTLAAHNQADPTDVFKLMRIDELTPIKMPSPWRALTALNMSRDTDPRFVLAFLLAIIAACIALPGLGDQLGTAPRIKNGIHSVIRSFN